MHSKARDLRWLTVITFVYVVVAALPSAGASEQCIQDLHNSILEDGWLTLAAPEMLDPVGMENVTMLQSFSIKREAPLEPGGNTYPRYRIDVVQFSASDLVPLFNHDVVQVHSRSGPGTEFPARQYYRPGSGINFSQVTWDYSYVLFSSARVGKYVVIVYTPATSFEPYLPNVRDAIVDLMESTCLANADKYVMCSYLRKPTKENVHSEWGGYENCARYGNGKLEIGPKHIVEVNFGPSGIAPFWTAAQWFYIKPSGEFLPVVSYDNAADDFREGLVRAPINGKIAYFNKSFKQVISPKYDWGSPFNSGRAFVCKGCSIQDPDEDGHKLITGGVWGYINRAGEEVVPVQYSREEIRGK